MPFLKLQMKVSKRHSLVEFFHFEGSSSQLDYFWALLLLKNNYQSQTSFIPLMHKTLQKLHKFKEVDQILPDH